MGFYVGLNLPKKLAEKSAIAVKGLNSPGLHIVGGVPGLGLQISTSGGRSWILRTTVGVRRRDIGLGGYPEVGLAEARERARSVRERIRNGEDPIQEKQKRRSALLATATLSLTFDQCAAKYIDAHRAGWRSEKHASQWGATLETYVSPICGKLLVSDLTMAHVLQVLEQPVEHVSHLGAVKTGKFWEIKTETATRVRGRVEKILDWAKGRGLRSGDNPAAWKGNLDAQLAKPTKVKRVEHFPAVPISELPEFMVQLRRQKGVAARALELAILCSARSGEVRFAVWSEFDLDNGLWVIPAERMKAGREHRVPLSRQAIELLKSLPVFLDQPLVFPGAKAGPLSDMSITAVMRRLKRKEVPHGFRSTFRDWIAETTTYPRDMAEMALAHVISSEVEAAYRRGDMLERRRQMMQDWADFALKLAQEVE